MCCLLVQRRGCYGVERRAEAAHSFEWAGGEVAGGRPRASDMHHFSLFHCRARRYGHVHGVLFFCVLNFLL